MTPQQLTELFFKLESQKDFIDRFDFKNTNSWMHIKFSIYQATISRNKISKSSISNLPTILKLIFSNFRILLFKKKKSNLFFGNSRGLNSFQELQKDVYYPYDRVKFSDSNILYNLNKFIDYEKNTKFYKENNIFNENIISPLVSKISKLGIFKFILFKDFDLETNTLGVTARQLRYFHTQFILNYFLYSFLLRFYPKQQEAFIVSAYSKSFICAALKNKGIPITEIQHGHIGKKHFGYNYGCLKNSLPLPNKILVNNFFWKEELEKSNFIKDISIRKIEKNISTLSEEMQNLKPYILFTGQGMYMNEILSFFKESISVKEIKGINIVYKPHPSESNDSVLKTFCKENNNRINYYQGADNIDTLLHNSLGHISVTSFCHFHAIEYLKQTFVLEVEGEDNIFKDYIINRPKQFISIKNYKDIDEFYSPKTNFKSSFKESTVD